jgi:hypothetical protein
MDITGGLHSTYHSFMWCLTQLHRMLKLSQEIRKCLVLMQLRIVWAGLGGGSAETACSKSRECRI